MLPLAPLAPRLVRSEIGQASVELVAIVPFVLLCAAFAWQLALAGQTAWLCANAARVAARAEAVGRDGRAAARGALPALLIVAIVVFQLLSIGYAKVLAGDAAEAGALALAGGKDAARAARRAVPGGAKAGMRVRVARGTVSVTMHSPSPLRALGRRLEVGATAAVGER